MKIGIDGRYAQGDLVGVGNYIKNLVDGLTFRGFKCVVFYSKKPKLKINNCKSVILYVSNRYLFEQVFLPIALVKNRIDIYHGTANSGLPILTFIPTVLTIHDLIPLNYRGYFKFSRQPFISKKLFSLNMVLSTMKANRIITDSNFVKKEVVRKLRIQTNNVKVIYLGVSIGKIGPLPLKLRRSLYILDHGGIDVRKNLEIMIEAFSIIIKKIPNCKLVITGDNLNLKPRLKTLVKELDIEKSVIFTGYVGEETLGALIKHAGCICYPSLMEGFGMPVLEGFQTGVPVVCSNVTSLPELAQDSAILVNPMSSKEIAAGIISALKNKKKRTKMIEKGKLVVKKFNWNNTVDQTVDVYREVLS